MSVYKIASFCKNKWRTEIFQHYFTIAKVIQSSLYLENIGQTAYSHVKI